jgi:hypothetical protein
MAPEMMHAKRAAAAIVALLASWPNAALSQPSAEDFYRGKKIDLIIGYSSGGTYDLYARLVARHLKAHPATRRVDADVWKPFEREFRQRDILARFQEKILAVGELRHRFEIAWQPPGRALRLFQPLNFDLLEPSDIVEKAIKWGGLIRQLRKADSEFVIYLLLGRPVGQGQSAKAFQQACDTLNEDTVGQKELVQEEEAPRFAAAVEKEIKAVANH